MTDLSVILPSYKGASQLKQSLPALQQWLGTLGKITEVIVVDDGSADNGATEQVVKEAGCTFIGLPQNLGKGGAVRAGMRAASGKIRLFTDADVPFDEKSMALFIEYLENKEFHIAIGDRTLEASKYFTEISGARKLGSGIFTFLVGRFVTTGLHDTQCGLKGFRAEIADDLFGVSKLNSFAFDVELLYIALKRNYDIKRLPVVFKSSHDESSVSLLKHAPGMMLDLFRIKWNHITGKYNRRTSSHQ
ncbi:MAG: glycosyltransferase [Bacteroidia bacterium]|nr:glycosyltransferase [Bacteroidia bacterium]